MASYLVKFTPREGVEGRGYIDGFKRARDAKACVERVNTAKNYCFHAEYLGQDEKYYASQKTKGK